ncbi:MAG: hypothetical protein OEL89_01835 [Candidatus Peregrinibacteria bacterium]|nr:hypothetical protein [Candidatus Peregrinibacteria bacterium]
MNQWKFFLAFGIAFFIFVGLLVAENGRFELASKIENPFKNATVLAEKDLSNNTKSQELFTESGEFFRFSKGSKADFTNKNRTFLSGEMFVSAALISDIDFKQATKYSTQKLSPRVAQIKIGPILVSYPGASVLITRDQQNARSEVYAFGHSIEIAWKNTEKPFVVPAGMKVTIREKLIGAKTSALYYTKLKKELQMKPFKIDFLGKEDSQDTAGKFGYFLQKLSPFGEKMKRYVKIVPETWRITNSETFLGKSVSSFKNLQANYTIGFPKHKKATIEFEELIEEFVKAHFFVQERKLYDAKDSLEKFATTIESSKWRNFVKNNPNLAKEWEVFVKAQNGQLRIIFPEDPEKIFADFWLTVNAKDSFEKIENTFSDIEILVSQRFFSNAKEKLVQLKSELSETEFNKNFNFRLTKIRRLVSEILSNERFFQEKEIFELYAALINYELTLHTDQNVLEEIRLESGQNVLHFLSKFLQEQTDIEISKILLATYEKLDTANIAKKLGRQIFTAKELETVDFITFVGDSGLTKEEIEAIKNAKKYQTELYTRLDSLRIQNEAPEDTHSSGFIANSKNLKTLFEEEGVLTDTMKFKTFRKDNERYLVQFSEGSFAKKDFSGTFEIPSQTLKTITVGDKSEKKLPIRYLGTFLRKFETEKAEESENKNTQISGSFIPQKTDRAIIERRIVTELFILEGFDVSRQDIEIKDSSYEKFLILDSIYNKDFHASFEYNKSTEKIKNVALKKGNFKLSLGGQTFDRKNIGQALSQKIKELLPDE